MQSGLNSKRKGDRGERELVKLLEKRFGKGKFKRTPSSGAYVGGGNREISEDLPWEAKITLVSDIITPVNFKFVLEHKFYALASFWDLFNEKAELNKWLEQVKNDAIFVKKDPMLIVKYNRKSRICYIRKEWLPRLCKFRILQPGGGFTIFETWYCYWLKDLLEQKDTFWFEK